MTLTNAHLSRTSTPEQVPVSGQGEGAPEPAVDWPKKVNLFGMNVSATNYAEATDAIRQAAELQAPAAISCHAAHAIVTFTGRSDWTEKLNRFNMITPDGQPVRWAMNWLHETGLTDRVYGPKLMSHVCQMAANHNLPIFLYGGSETSLGNLKTNLLARYPELTIAGGISPPYREITEEENQQFVETINSSGARILFIGLGCPKQDLFASKNQHTIQPVQICVGAAFDFHAGSKSTAPAWMQRNGLEWMYRLACEPRRLLVRYLVTNTLFVFRFIKQALGIKT